MARPVPENRQQPGDKTKQKNSPLTRSIGTNAKPTVDERTLVPRSRHLLTPLVLQSRLGTKHSNYTSPSTSTWYLGCIIYNSFSRKRGNYSTWYLVCSSPKNPRAEVDGERYVTYFTIWPTGRRVLLIIILQIKLRMRVQQLQYTEPICGVSEIGQQPETTAPR